MLSPFVQNVQTLKHVGLNQQKNSNGNIVTRLSVTGCKVLGNSNSRGNPRPGTFFRSFCKSVQQQSAWLEHRSAQRQLWVRVWHCSQTHAHYDKEV